MNKVAIGIMCKTPAPGRSKTRLSPPLLPAECAAISACFIQDLAGTIGGLAAEGPVAGYGVYTPIGSEPALRRLLPAGFSLLPQVDGDFGERLFAGIEGLLALGHAGAILVNSDSPTLPPSILRDAAAALRHGDNVVLSRAADGGYTLIGLSRPHRRLFEDIAWSTSSVYQTTLLRAREIGLRVVDVAPWYDIDDGASLGILQDEFLGIRPEFSDITGAPAPLTRQFLRRRDAMRPDVTLRLEAS